MADKLLAEWFWTDRWMGSSGFLLPLEPRGLYREMLTQAWRRGAMLPNDHAAIMRATGVTREEWDRCWPLISRYWTKRGEFLVNETQVLVYEECKGASDRAQARSQVAAKASAEARAQAKLELERKLELEQSPPSSVVRSPLSVTGSDEQTSTDHAPSARASDGVEEQARAYVRVLDAVFDRKTRRVTPKVFQRWRARIKDGWKPEELTALPILVAAQGKWSLKDKPDPEVLLRDGRNPKTRDGQTFGATDFADKAYLAVDGTKLNRTNAEIARQAGVLEMLLGRGCLMESGE